MATAERLLDVTEAAALLNVSKVAIRKWSADGRIPVTRLGRRVLFDPRALDRFIRERTRQAAPPSFRGAA